MKLDVVTVGGATEDIAFYTQEGELLQGDDILRQQLIAFEYGAKINVENVFFGFGGGATNAAVCLSKLGMKVACCAVVGEDSRGQKIVSNLRNNGVKVNLIHKSSKKNTGLSFVLICQNNERIIFSNRGANSELDLDSRDLSAISESKWVYISSLSGKWDKVVSKIFSVKGINVAWNPGHSQLQNGYQVIGKYLQKTKVLILNKDEAIELVLSNPKYNKNDYKFLNNTFDLLKTLYSWGPGVVIITNGKDGAVAFDGDNFYNQPVYKAKMVADKTGVGDAFGSSFVAGMQLYGGDIKKALDLGAKNSASVVAKQGAQNGLITLKNIKRK